MQSTQSLRNENQCLESYVEVQLRAIALGNDMSFHQECLSDLEAYNTSARKEEEKKREEKEDYFRLLFPTTKAVNII